MALHGSLWHEVAVTQYGKPCYLLREIGSDSVEIALKNSLENCVSGGRIHDTFLAWLRDSSG